MRIRYEDEHGATQTLEATGALSELLQHEMDHLDGILAVDRALGRDAFCTREEYERRHRVTLHAAPSGARPVTASTATPASGWAALRRPVFRNLWMAAIVSNVGGWMQDTAGAWLMTALTTSPLLIALMQTAASLPPLFLALPRRRPPPTFSTGAACCSSGKRGCWPASPSSPP